MKHINILLLVAFAGLLPNSCTRKWNCNCDYHDLTGADPDTTYVFVVEGKQVDAGSSCTSGTYDNAYETYTCTLED